MRKPILNSEQRELIRHKTHSGAILEFGLALDKLRREIYRSSVFGWFYVQYFDLIFKIELTYKKSF